MKESVLLVLGFVLINNCALSSFLGLTPMLGFARRGEKILVLGLSVTGVTLLSSLILWLLRGLIPGYWRILAAAAVVLILVYLLQLLLGKRLGVWFPVIALNSAVLGLSLNVLEAESLLTVLLSALGVGLGFLFGLLPLQRLPAAARLPSANRGATWICDFTLSG